MLSNENSLSMFIPQQTQLSSIQFGLPSPQFIKDFSVVSLSNPNSIENSFNNGVNDIRMGPIERNGICGTCCLNYFNCPGHFGMIKLWKPVFHIAFIDQCIKTLRCFCINCHRFLLRDYIDDFNELKKIKNKKIRQNKIFKFFINKEKIQCGLIHKSKKNYNNKEKIIKKNENGKKSCIKKVIEDEELEEEEKSCDIDLDCEMIQPKYRKDETNPSKIIMDYSSNGKKYNLNEIEELTAEKALQILSSLSNEDIEILGYDEIHSRPEWMIIQYLLVTPPQTRPSCFHNEISISTKRKFQDSLTYQYNKILKINQNLQNAFSYYISNNSISNYHFYSEEYSKLQKAVNALFTNDFKLTMEETQRKNLAERLKGKEGRIRGNLMGKRVDFSARSVISPDPQIPPEEVGVPISLAKKVTFPETVNSYNIKNLQKLIKNGPNHWPGANYIIYPNGKKIDLKMCCNLNDVYIDIGFIVERHLQNGDYVIFNRQPSLHKMSIMGHRVRILPKGLTFRINLSVTEPYNADFDGDDMNLHFPQSYESVSEIKYLTRVQKQIISPKTNAPIMGIKQDALVGSKIFSSRDTFLNREEVMDLIGLIKDFDFEENYLPMPCIFKPQMLWSGKQIFSMLLPKELNIYKKNEDNVNNNKKSDLKFNIDEKEIFQILRGELIQGELDSKTLGSTEGGIVHFLYEQFGSEITSNFLFNCQKIINNFLLKIGFTASLEDTICPPSITPQISNELSSLESILEFSESSSSEDYINSSLNNVNNTISSLLYKNIPLKNHLYQMIESGSKGKLTNLTQIMALIGQQNLEGKRIPSLIGDEKNRTLPHFSKNERSPEGGGFIKHSFLEGLSPQELFFHAMAGREGVIDTAIKTSKIGYLSRKMIKGLEDIMVCYDRTVRDSMGNIVQFTFGEDGFGYEFLENVRIDIVNKNEEIIKEEFEWKDLEKNIGEFLEDKLVNEILKNEKMKKKINKGLNEEFEQIQKDIKELINMKNDIFINGDDFVKLPINIDRIIENEIINNPNNNNSNKTKSKKSDLNPLFILDKVSELKNSLKIFPIINNKNFLNIFFFYINISLNTKKLLQIHKLSKKQFLSIIDLIKKKFHRALSTPGEMVGTMAAESLSEPTTQMTLNTFHLAGISSVNVTLGVPRLTEILNASKNIETPSMTIYLKNNNEDNDNKNMENLAKIKTKIELTLFKDLVEKSEIFFMPDIMNSFIEEDREWFDNIMMFEKETDDFREKKMFISPWLLRIELNKDKSNKFGLQRKCDLMELIKEKIKKEVGKKIYIISTLDSDLDNKIIYIRLDASSLVYKNINNNIKNKKNKINQNKNEAEIKSLLSYERIQLLRKEILTKIKIDGIDSIKKVFYKENKNIPILETEGSNLLKVFEVDEIDYKKTSTNDINEVFEVLGIEAARKTLIKEIRKIFDSYGIYVNYRNMAILADFMTQRGNLTAVNRFGINKINFGPLRKATFEEVIKVFTNAGLFAEKDKLNGISESILVGQKCKAGTGAFDLFLDLGKNDNKENINYNNNYKNNNKGNNWNNINLFSNSVGKGNGRNEFIQRKSSNHCLLPFMGSKERNDKVYSVFNDNVNNVKNDEENYDFDY